MPHVFPKRLECYDFSEMRSNSAIGHIPSISSPQEDRHKQIISSTFFVTDAGSLPEAPATNHQRLRHMLYLHPGAAGKRTRVDRKR